MRYRKPNFPQNFSNRQYDFTKLYTIDPEYLKTPFAYLYRNLTTVKDVKSTETLKVREFNAIHLLEHKNYTYNIPNQETYNKLYYLYASFPVFIRDVAHILSNIGISKTKSFNQDVLNILELAVLGRIKDLKEKTLLDIPDYIWVKYFWDVVSKKDYVAFRYIGYLEIEQELIQYFLTKSTKKVVEISPLINTDNTTLACGRYNNDSLPNRNFERKKLEIQKAVYRELFGMKGWGDYVTDPPKTIHDYEYFLSDVCKEFAEQRELFTGFIANLISQEYKIDDIVSYNRLVHYIYNFKQIADLIENYYDKKEGHIFVYDRASQVMRSYEENVLFTNEEDSQKDRLVSVYSKYAENPFNVDNIKNLKQFLISQKLCQFNLGIFFV